MTVFIDSRYHLSYTFVFFCTVPLRVSLLYPALVRLEMTVGYERPCEAATACDCLFWSRFWLEHRDRDDAPHAISELVRV
jgi:hypothetical protein